MSRCAAFRCVHVSSNILSTTSKTVKVRAGSFGGHQRRHREDCCSCVVFNERKNTCDFLFCFFSSIPCIFFAPLLSRFLPVVPLMQGHLADAPPPFPMRIVPCVLPLKEFSIFFPRGLVVVCKLTLLLVNRSILFTEQASRLGSYRGNNSAFPSFLDSPRILQDHAISDRSLNFVHKKPNRLG